MIEKNEQIYNIVRAIITACPTRSKLREAIKLIKEPEYRQEILNYLVGILGSKDDGYGSFSFRTMTSKHTKNSYVRNSTFSAIAKYLKAAKITSDQLHDIVLIQFNEHVPTKNQGVEQYLMRLAGKQYFDKLISYMFNFEPTLRNTAKDDAWLREMLIEQKRKNEEENKR